MKFDRSDERPQNDLRETWSFRYKPAEVLASAERQLKHHAERRQWWETEATKAEQMLKEKGFEYREERNSIGRDIQIVGDPELAHRVSSCKRRIEEHRQSEALYETWTRALAAKAIREPGQELELKIGDVVFFEL